MMNLHFLKMESAKRSEAVLRAISTQIERDGFATHKGIKEILGLTPYFQIQRYTNELNGQKIITFIKPEKTNHAKKIIWGPRHNSMPPLSAVVIAAKEVANPTTISALAKEYVSGKKWRRLGTEEQFGLFIDRMIAIIGDLKASEIGPDAFGKYIEARRSKVQPLTLFVEASVLLKLLDLAVSTKKIKNHPVTKELIKKMVGLKPKQRAQSRPPKPKPSFFLWLRTAWKTLWVK